MMREISEIITIENVAEVGNLFEAARKARKHKSRRSDVESSWMKRVTEIIQLHEELLSGNYSPAGYRFFEITDPKRRTIAAAPFRDRVVHQAFTSLIEKQVRILFFRRILNVQTS